MARAGAQADQGAHQRDQGLSITYYLIIQAARCNVVQSADVNSHVPREVGFVAALAACAAAALFGIAQLLQILHVLRPPLDGILIFTFSLCIAFPFLIAMLALHYASPTARRFWSGAALVFSIIYATYVALNYTVQLATVIPAAHTGTLDQIRVLDQTPHSLFWDVDALGYICMGFATLFGSFVFSDHGIGKWAKGFFLANALMTPLVAIVYFYPTFSVPLLMLASPWIVTVAGSMLCLAIHFKSNDAPVPQLRS
jgi:hypothetical protein